MEILQIKDSEMYSVQDKRNIDSHSTVWGLKRRKKSQPLSILGLLLLQKSFERNTKPSDMIFCQESKLTDHYTMLLWTCKIKQSWKVSVTHQVFLMEHFNKQIFHTSSAQLCNCTAAFTLTDPKSKNSGPNFREAGTEELSWSLSSLRLVTDYVFTV